MGIINCAYFTVVRVDSAAAYILWMRINCLFGLTSMCYMNNDTRLFPFHTFHSVMGCQRFMSQKYDFKSEAKMLLPWSYILMHSVTLDWYLLYGYHSLALSHRCIYIAFHLTGLTSFMRNTEVTCHGWRTSTFCKIAFMHALHPRRNTSIRLGKCITQYIGVWYEPQRHSFCKCIISLVTSHIPS